MPLSQLGDDSLSAAGDNSGPMTPAKQQSGLMSQSDSDNRDADGSSGKKSKPKTSKKSKFFLMTHNDRKSVVSQFRPVQKHDFAGAVPYMPIDSPQKGD